MKELTIEGIKPPPHSVAFGSYTTSNIAAQVRPVVNLPGKTSHSKRFPQAILFLLPTTFIYNCQVDDLLI